MWIHLFVALFCLLFFLEGLDPERHRQIVTLVLIGLLAVIIVGHYIGAFLLDWNSKKPENISNAFNAVLPVISGLTGSAVTYYFTRQK